ncbi:MAG: SseB family protein [Marinosulfonomonas sp.]
MTEQTLLDAAHARMAADDTDDVARLQYYERVADTEFFLLLLEEAEGDRVAPQTYSVDDQEFVLIFDREERLSEFLGGPAPYIALSGRAIAQMLAGKAVGLGINLGSGASAMLLPAQAVDWLAATLDDPTEQGQARPEEIFAPTDIPQDLLTGLNTKLALATGLAKMAYLTRVTYSGGQSGHLLGIIDAVEGAETPLAQSASEALRFSGVEAGQLDVAFFKSSDPICAKMARVGLRFDIPEPVFERPAAVAPGMDPDKPPRLR